MFFTKLYIYLVSFHLIRISSIECSITVGIFGNLDIYQTFPGLAKAFKVAQSTMHAITFLLLVLCPSTVKCYNNNSRCYKIYIFLRDNESSNIDKNPELKFVKLK